MKGKHISSEQALGNDLAQGLVRVGKEGIEKSNDDLLDEYFAEEYVLHGPNGELNRDQLKEYFAALRDAFAGFILTRDQILVQGNFVAARNTMPGTFEHEFKLSPVGPVQPTGKYVSWKLLNFFRYDGQGRLAEEWIQMDNLGFLKQLGVTVGENAMQSPLLYIPIATHPSAETRRAREKFSSSPPLTVNEIIPCRTFGPASGRIFSSPLLGNDPSTTQSGKETTTSKYLMYNRRPKERQIPWILKSRCG